ncbi:MAG: recombinase family protein [bacterium]|jgi:DNA invertase Pin-like site-specific DNA recombinase
MQTETPRLPLARRAAQYVRMSTEHQQYSTENQSDKIKEYAARNDIEIVRTYADEGKSGLNIGGREGLQNLLADVRAGKTDFGLILVYDVSRWGRFQDADESAHYEFICKQAGIRVVYCAEQFDNDGSPVSTIVKGVKRAMAGEYSRELSAKVFAGQCRLIELGYRQGGPAGFGLRRVLLDQSGALKAELKRGEHKSLQTDRVVLRPGPDEEIEVVRRIYRCFLEESLNEGEIARQLNADGLRTDLGRLWTSGTVHQILTNEKYIGNNVYNRKSFKLKQRRVMNPPEAWVRKPGAFEPVVPVEWFFTAQGIIQARSRRQSDAELLDRLKQLYQERGYLSGILIDETEGMASSSVYASRFGGLVRAYALIGFSPDRDYAFLEINKFLRRMHPELVQRVESEIMALGAEIERDNATDLLRINDEFSASLILARCNITDAGKQRWKLRLDTSLRPDITIAVRLNQDNTAPLDYYLLPWIDLGPSRLTLGEVNASLLDGYRFDDLSMLYSMSQRASIRRAA